MEHNNQRPLNNLWNALLNVVKLLFMKNMWLFLVLIYLTYMGVQAFNHSETFIVFILSVIITMISIGIYIQTKSYSETTLSFVLGLFVVFTTDWNTGIFMVFISFYLIFNLVVFSVASIKLTTNVETIIMESALKYRELDFKDTKKKLENISRTMTKGQQLGATERAECIRFLAYRRVAISELRDALEIIELIKVVSQTRLDEVLKLFYSLYTFDVLLNGNVFSGKRIERMYDEIVTLPTSPDDFLIIFDQLKKYVITGNLSYEMLLNKIREHLLKGYDATEIVSIIRKENDTEAVN